MSDVSNGCPTAETLGAFLEGRLDGPGRDAVVVHLAGCSRCVANAEFVARMRDEPPAENVVPLAPRRTRWMFAAAAAVVVLGLAALFVQLRGRQAPGIRTLAAAAPSSYRTVEPRLAGFRWAALQRLRADAAPSDPEALRLAGAAGEVLQRAREDSSAEAAHAAGVAELLLRNTGPATEHLRAAAERERSAAVWNDLAAAYYTSAVHDRRMSDLPRALAAADRALELDGNLHEARFNRALVLERMGMRAEAAAAWRDYLARDPSSPWAVEARRHEKTLGGVPAVSLDRVERAAAARDGAAVDAAVAANAQDVRAWFESDVLGRWGASVLKGDGAAAQTLLGAAAEAGAGLRRASGESLLRDAVEAIEAAGAAQRLDLAAAHDAFRRGRLLYRDRRLADAQAALLEAARGFEANGSPMAGVARFFAACTLFDQNRVDEAARAFEGIEPASGHDALRAQVALQLARCRQYAGRWEDAVRGFGAAGAAFTRLRERENAAFAAAALGSTLDELGARDDAWTHRIAALEQSRQGPRRVATLAAAVRSELRAEEWEVARALLGPEAEATEALGDPLLLADVWRRRALVDARLGDERAAAGSIARSRALLARTPASGLRERLEAEVRAAEAATIRRQDPRRAAAMLAEAIAFFEASGHRIGIPDALLERGRALRAAGREDDALDAFRAGLDEIESQRSAAPAGSAIFDAVAPLVEETIALQLARGDAAGAFETAERAHARALLDGSATPPATAAGIAETLPAGAMLVAYALVPDGLAAICVTRGGAEAVQTKTGRRELAAAVRALRESIAARADLDAVRERSAALERVLLAPLPGLEATTSLVIVPDRFLHAVPWAALYDVRRGVFAVERHALTIAPSAALWVRRSGPAAERGRLLAVAGDPAAAADPLEYAPAEASAVGDAYGGRFRQSGAGSAAQFLTLAAGADIVHFAGHARLGGEPALLFGDGGEVRAAEIARAPLARPRLVVLAACGTAAGAGEGFDGPRGLARAFLTAGASAVVGTLWPVDDAEAAALFSEFHRRLGGGEDAADALRHAQLALLRGADARSRHPAAWAAPELFGANVWIPKT
ncbi:MAG TPA: CHAT domain-containing protein [Thermoanaerobaculia bacterium]|nr:CHAT domain-containing protein [Thermoanaerobaculia bacterium]